jgi:hypothetical protein
VGFCIQSRPELRVESIRHKEPYRLPVSESRVLDCAAIRGTALQWHAYCVSRLSEMPAAHEGKSRCRTSGSTLFVRSSGTHKQTKSGDSVRKDAPRRDL